MTFSVVRWSPIFRGDAHMEELSCGHVGFFRGRKSKRRCRQCEGMPRAMALRGQLAQAAAYPYKDTLNPK